MNDVSEAARSATTPHRQAIRVYFEDTDAAGIVYYANYLKFAERARTDMLRDLGISHAEMMKRDGLVLVVRRCEIDYLKPAQARRPADRRDRGGEARRRVGRACGSACCATTRFWRTSRCWWCASARTAGPPAFPIMCAGSCPA